ncbi:MAG: thioesterase family protein [Deltaproteobacteria bacterium]|nr:thioesterase family protein [Deltaproteobacteria bacterium]
MSRIKLELPQSRQFIFSTSIAPRISDINYGNHLGHDHLITLLHEVRLRFLKEHGFSEFSVAGSSMIMADLAITYQAEVTYGDILTVDIALLDPSRVGCDFFYLVRKKEHQQEVARAKTGIIFFDYRLKKVTRMPDVFAELIKA